ncbi:ATP-binding cassette domain-containing protein [Peribacillus frigoritolerans]|uniref:ABC transporter ATP-binding protein n=1 Tax=Peribacillus frigoritolerans TaxID=450367 RepID=UPI002E1FC577|nr:ATP-binding cassette domain-containing protein [Peribacillus frigoritolerans]MED3993757.1 ATP-binding cassette domain-containing protein [Peribacillus frigoritolerans]
MKKEVVIKTKRLVKTFKGKEVIKNFDMTVQKGTIYGFLGANGAGKTTVFKLLMGLLIPNAGKIEILGLDHAENKYEILQCIGSIIETPIFYEHLSAKENLEIHLSYMGVPNSHIENTLEIVGLKGVGKQPVSEFSLGMRQRLGIARAIIHKPKILILDEPINGLDPIGIREMRELFIDLVTNQNMTILISSHILSEIEHIADTIGVIVDGNIIEEVTLSSIKEQYPDGLEDYFFNLMKGGNKNV